MASSPVTAPSRDSPSSPTPPSPASPPPTTSSAPPPPPTSSSPPPTPSSSSSPPPQQETSPPPPATSPPPETPPPSPPTATPATPPPKTSPPPSSNDSSSSPPPPPSQANPTPPPPPPASRSSSPPSSSGSLSPPPPTHKTPPSSHTTHSDSPPTHQESSSTTEKLPLIIGITAGAGLLFIVMIIIIVSCAKKKKRRRRPHDQMQFYKDPSREHKGSEYYKSPQHPNWHKSPQSIDQRVPQPPGAVGSVWPGPPPPPMMSSSEMSSNFSGPHHPPLPPPSPNVALGFNKSTFSYDELAAATNGFAQSNLLGQGGFGYVHKGILANGKEIAVKSLKSGSGQGEREFQAEVEIISRVHHRHLVSLVGYCIAGGQRLLVYEFVPNKTLEYHLHGPGCPTMDWPTRLRIALGSAKGLAYLHEDCHPRIIHRDIKAANILLDNKFEAMVADFGLAKLSSDNNTHVSTRVMGTFGYLAPEYASSGKLTEKSDVFSYGVMLLELITGRRPVDTTNAYMEDSLVDWARPLLTSVQGDGNYDELVDPRLENNYSHREMAQMVACAAASIRHSARRRPKMSQIVRALEGDVSLEDLNDGVKTSQSINSSSNGSSEYDTAAYNADMKKFRKMALASQEMGSSEYEATSDYGLKPSSSSDS